MSSCLVQVLEKADLLKIASAHLKTGCAKLKTLEPTKKTDLKTTCSRLECQLFHLEETTSHLTNLKNSFSKITMTQDGKLKEIDTDALIESKLEKTDRK